MDNFNTDLTKLEARILDCFNDILKLEDTEGAATHREIISVIRRFRDELKNIG